MVCFVALYLSPACAGTGYVAYAKVGLTPHAPEVQPGTEGERCTMMIKIVPCLYAPLGKYFAHLASGNFNKVVMKF
jgi:hypothetical protein